VVTEVVKHFYNIGQDPRIYFYRDSHHNEVDLLIQLQDQLAAIEIKSAQTFNTDFLKSLNQLTSLLPGKIRKDFLVYDGSAEQSGQRSILNFRRFIKEFPLED
jgi:predicted AAA+ superfamily ATPase